MNIRSLSKDDIGLLVESFRGYKRSKKGIEDYMRRSQDEPSDLRNLLRKAKQARKSNDTPEFISLVYYGLLPSKKRNRLWGIRNPSVPSGATDLPKLLSNEGYSDTMLAEQADLIFDIMNSASKGDEKQVFAGLNGLHTRGLDRRVKLGEITPSLFTLNSKFMVVNRRVIATFQQMSLEVLGVQTSLSRSLSEYSTVLLEIQRFRENLAKKYGFEEILLEHHWFNMFCGICYEWKYSPQSEYRRIARQSNPERRAFIENEAMKRVLECEREEHRTCDDMHLSESYDIKSTSIDGSDVRYIEVKGHGDLNRTAELTKPEYEFAQEKGSAYWLYIVYDIDSGSPRLFKCQNPLLHMNVERKETYRYYLSGTC